ncbi:murein hydrolase regulator LrgA [Neobacillus piezotolerans]|uniref:Murein hydrolase regulator LrgA n=1 Tax=Neobacillus piezotolerans TaxID=2259171 RepID=A0A3D8GNU4_9BACI|nr:murein hydrolase regulator LrgA [Neobacillus piezotolerans]
MRVKQALLFFLQLFFIWIIYSTSVQVTRIFHLPIPASVLGMAGLFLLLCSGIVKLHYVELAGSFLNRHLGFFFIPITVGLMDFGGLIKASGLQILVMIAGSTVLGLLVTGGLAHYFSGEERN